MKVCGDSRCEGKYHFIGQGIGKGKKGKVTYAEAWEGFRRYGSSQNLKGLKSSSLDRLNQQRSLTLQSKGIQLLPDGEQMSTM